jgi:ABC-type Mn2+/Zn2+ transport system ATPase subunit
VIGPNGSGKSTFVRTALGLVSPVSGTLQRRAGLRLAYVPQQSALDAIFPISVLDFVLMGLQGPENVTLLRAPRQRAVRAVAALEEAGARALERRQLRDLSGGQRQRVLIARALATDADLVFLDEPTTALDATAEHEVLQLTEQLRAKRGAAVVMVTHLVEDGLERADHALLLESATTAWRWPTTRRRARAAREFERSTAASSAAARPARERRSSAAPSWQSCGRTSRSSGRDLGGAAWRGRCWARSASTSCCGRMVFASSAIAQAAALGVALSFWLPADRRSVGTRRRPLRRARPRTSRRRCCSNRCCGRSPRRCSRRWCSSPTPCTCT